MTSNSNIQYSDKFQIHLRFQLVKVAKNEFRFVTISESIKIKIDNDSFPLEKVLMQLQKGISLKSLLSSVPKLNQSETIDVVESLFKRRLIEKINAEVSYGYIILLNRSHAVAINYSLRR